MGLLKIAKAGLKAAAMEEDIDNAVEFVKDLISEVEDISGTKSK